MGLFGKKKKQECDCGGACEPQVQEPTECDCGGACEPQVQEPAECDCGGACAAPAQNTEATAKFIVLGSGCKKCYQLEDATKEALKELGIDEEVLHITDMAKIAAYGVMSVPALVVEGKVVSMGKVLKSKDIVKLLSK